MAIELSDDAKVAMNTALTALVDAGPGAGDFVVLDSLDNELVTITLQNPAYTVNGTTGVASANGLPLSGVAGVGGVATTFRVRDSDGTIVFRGTVGLPASGADAIIDTVDVNASDTVNLNSHTITPLN
jgi:hypothetical protein